MKKQDAIDVAQTLIDQSTYAVFDFDKDDALSHFECRHCHSDIRNDHDKDCIILKAQKIVNEPEERRKKHREAITSSLNDRIKSMSDEIKHSHFLATQKYKEGI